MAFSDYELTIGDGFYDYTPDIREWTNVSFDEYAFWNRALSVSEISRLWNSGNGLDIP
jgi:hypothetical protein